MSTVSSKAESASALELAAKTSTNRHDLWTQFISRTQVQTALEVGVFRGNFAQHILHNCPTVDRYYMIDPWRHLTNWNKPANKSDREFERIKQEALKKTAFARSRRTIIEGTTIEISERIPEQEIDFAYIDADHTLRGITIDLIRIWPKIRSGGILAGDDFCRSIWQHNLRFEPTFVFPMAVHFAEAMNCIIYGLPFNQFAILTDRSLERKFEFIDLTGSYSSTAVGAALQSQREH